MGDIKVVEQGAKGCGQRIAFSLRDGLEDSQLPSETALVDGRVLLLSDLAIGDWRLAIGDWRLALLWRRRWWRRL